MRARLPPSQRLDEGRLRLLGDLQGEGDPRQHQVTIGERCERHPRDPVRERLGGFGRALECEARLPGPTGTGQREQRHVLTAKEVGERDHLVIAADERCGRHGKVRAVERPDRWEVPLAELVDPFGGLQVLESMIAEIDQREPFRIDLLHRRERHQDLAAAPGGRDPGGAVDVGADVPFGRANRGARVDPDTDPDGSRPQGTISVPGSLERTAGRPEREEESVTLRVDLHPAVTSEGLPQHAAMLRQDVRIGALPELVEQPRGSFDVSEQERDRSSRQVSAHDRKP